MERKVKKKRIFRFSFIGHQKRKTKSYEYEILQTIRDVIIGERITIAYIMEPKMNSIYNIRR